MGSTVRQVTGAVSNVNKNFTVPGWIAGGLKSAGIIKSNPFDDLKEGADKVLGAQEKGAGASSGGSGTSVEEAINKQVKASRDAALGLITDLQKQSRGEGPSLADAQLQAAGNRTLAQQLALAASQRGGSPAALQRALVMQQGQQGRDLAEQSATAKLQERQMAQQQLGNLTLGQQQQDLSQILSPAQLAQQAQLARDQAQLQKDLMLKQQQTAILGSLLGGAAAVGAAGIKGGGATAAMASDKNSKKNIKDGSQAVKEFLDALSAKTYSYKNPSAEGAAPGKRVGILAQDLEKSDLGKTLVKNTDSGKMVDTSQGFGAILAAQAELNGRLNKLESSLKKK